jgi:hypothetical protein
MNRPGVRAILPAILVAISTLFALTTATPAAAASVLSLKGNYGSVTLPDSGGPDAYGARCVYASNGHLDRGSVRGPAVLANPALGLGVQQWVGVSFRLQSYDVLTNPQYRTIFTSSVIKKQAAIDVAAEFDRRSWDVPQSLSKPVRVVVVVTWYKPGSKTTVDGSMKIAIDEYDATKGANQRSMIYRCYANWADSL